MYFNTPVDLSSLIYLGGNSLYNPTYAFPATLCLIKAGDSESPNMIYHLQFVLSATAILKNHVSAQFAEFVDIFCTT